MTASDLPGHAVVGMTVTDDYAKQINALLTRLATLRALHQRELGAVDYCRPCRHPWPCPTIQVLDAPEE